MEKRTNSGEIKRIVKILISLTLFLFASFTIFAAGETVNLLRETETVNYENGEYIEYILELENKTNINQTNLTLKDTFFNSSGLEDLSVELVESRGDGTSINIPSSPSEGSDLEISGITLGHTDEVSTGGIITTAEEKGYIKLKIKGKVKDVFSGDIISNGELSRASDNILEVTGISTLSRIVYDYDVTLRSVESTYAPGSVVTYKLHLENNSSTDTISGLKITDNSINLLTDILNLDGTVGINEQAFDYSNVIISAIVSGVGSSFGDYPAGLAQGGSIENVVLGPNGIVEYTITIPTKERTVGEIGTIGTSGDSLVKVYETLRGDNEAPVDALNKLSPKAANITITKEKTNTGKYLPGDEIEYNITITNNGEGYAYGYTLSDDLSIITTDLANDSTGSIDDSSDVISGSAFDSAIITLTEKGDNSGSSNYTEGNSQNTLNLNDDIYIGPGETLAYTIIGKVNESAIGKIDNQVSFTNGTDVNDSSIISMDPEDLNVSDITIEKTVGVTQYEPDTDVVYTIKVKNNATDKFVNNYNVIDNISDILTTQADGTQGQAFSNWTLNVVSPTTSTNGTKVGTNIAGSQTTDNINLTVDMAPGEEIIYELVAHVSVTSVGDILDNTSSGLDNVMESGNGIKSFPSQIAIRKTVDKTQYSPNEVLTYNIIIENKGKGYDVEVNIKDLLSSIKDKDGAGINNAFKSWSITSSFEGIDTNITPSGDSGLITEPLVDEDLNTTARIGAATRLIYTVQATVSGEACGKIKNIATINDELYSDKGSFAIDPDINVSISSDYPSYPKTGEDLESPFDITYTVKISNDSEAGLAKAVKIEDALSNVSTTALDGSTISNLFESWDISTNIYGDGTTLTSSSTYPLTGTTTDIDDTANITAGGYVEYIIKAKVKRDPSMDIIPYENIINTVTVTPKDKNEVIMSPINVSYTTSKKLPALRIEKSTSNLSYTLGGTVEYLLKVENIGEGYADNATISDELSNNFSEWTIEEEVPSPFVGTDADVNGNISNNTDINGTIDIAPGETITYKITGTVKSLLSGETITNIGTVTDTQRGNTYKASAKLMLADPTGIYITKNASQYSYSPGGEINYTVTLYNTTSLPLDFGVLGYEFRDKFSEINANLANDMGGTIADTTGSPFKKLFVSVNGGSETEITAEADYVHQPSLLAGIVESGNLIKPSEYTYKFRGILKDRVLSGEIKNEAVIEKTDGTQIAITSHEIDGSNSGSYTRNVDKSLYIPGEELTYTFTAKGNNGYLNNYSVNEDVKNIQVELLDGTTGNPFSIDDGEPQFTVERYVNGVLDGTSNSNGTVTSPVSDNENIVQTIDVSPEDTIIYKVKGTIRKDIVGAINFNGLVTEPYRHNLSIETTVEEGGYIPGEEITLKTTIENNSNGNAGNIDLQDLIDNLKLKLSDGTIGDLFPNGWTITAEKSGDNSQYINEGTFTDLSDINTEIGIPIGGKLIYKITGVVNELAVGETVNKVILDGDTVSANIQSLSSNLSVKKEVLSYYENNKTSEVSGGYVPNGWIKYKITINNIGKGIADDIAVSDALASIKTTAYDNDGSTKEINAFSEWEILSYEKTGTDSQSNINLTSGTEALGSTSLGWEMDIPSMGSITVYVLAHVSEGAIGDIKNTVTVDGKNYSSETSESLDGEAVLTKKAYESDGVTAISNYAPGDTVVYKVTVENTGDGIISGTIKDEISKIKSLVEEDGTNGTTPEGFSFSDFTVTASKSNSGTDNITKIGSFESESTKTDIDINDVLVIAPGTTVTFEIKGTIKDNVIGDIKNTAEFENESKSVTLKEKPSNISVEKRVTKVEDTDIAEGTDPINYNPGNTVEYEVIITNTGYGHEDNLTLTENIDKIQASIAGSLTTSTAFESYNIDITDSGNSYIRQVGLETVIDMAPGKKDKPEVVKIKVTGKLKDKVIGEIAENTVTYNNKTAKSEKLEPYDPKITYYKSFTDESKNEISESEMKYFSPGETIYYKLVVENTGNGYADDLKVIDKIYDLVTNNNYKAFEDGQVTVTTKIYNESSTTNGTDDGKTYIMGDISGNSLVNSTIDLASKSKVEFYISGKTTPYAIGSLTNTLTVTGEGNPTIESGKKDYVTTESIASNIVGDKIAGIDSSVSDVLYTPNGDISYKLTFNNTGNGPGIVYIKDIVSNIKVARPGGNKVNAFQSGYKFVLKTETGTVYHPYNSTTAISSEKTISGDLDTSINLGEDSSCSFTLTGKANIQAVESIENTATYKINSETETGTDISATIDPTPGFIEITNVADVTKYTPSKQVTYTLTIKNTGKGYAQNVNVEDLLENMTGDTFGGGSGPAFKSIDTITVTPGTNSASVGSGTTTDGYEGDFDIAPGENVVIKLTGTINDNLIGEITNEPIVKYKYKDEIDQTLTAPVTLKTTPPDLTILTEISANGSTYSTNKAEYIPNEKLYYKVTLSNAGGWDTDVKLTNIINQIKATDLNGNEVSAFNEDTIKITLESGIEDNITFDSALHELDATVNIGAGKDIVFKIEGVVNEDLIGTITLDSKYANSKGATTDDTSNSVDANPEENKIEITKTATSTTYYPKGEMVYNVVIENTGNSIVNDITFADDVNKTKVLLADGTTGDPFNSSTVTANIVSGETNLTTTIPTVSVDNGTGKVTSTTTFDIKPGKKITFQIKGTVNENAVGNIVNTATYEVKNGKTGKDTITTEPQETKIEITKTATSTTYYPNGEMVYNIVIENKGNSIGNDIIFEDDVNKEQVLLADGTNGNPFDVASITREIITGGTTLTGTVPTLSKNTTGKITSTAFDIKASERITFKITAKVNNNVVGDIINTATYKDANGKTDESKVTTKSEDSEIILTKIVEEPATNEYIPGEKIKYKITIKNTGKGFGDNINIVDKISKIMVDTVNGSAVAFSPSDWEWTKETEQLPNVIPNLTSFKGKDLDIDVDIESGKTLTLYVEGTVNSQAYGDISNTVTGKNGENDIPESTVNISSSLGKIEITNTADVAKYTPSKQVTYTLTIKNTGEGYAQNVNVEDLLSTMTGDTFDGGSGSAFKSIDTITVTPGTNSASIGSGTKTNGYEGNFNIAPGENIVIKLTGTINDNLIGEIINDPVVTYADNNQIEKAPVTLETATPDLTILTEISADGSTYSQNPVNYIPGEKLYYKVTLSNAGGWDSDVKLTNIINQIKATDLNGNEVSAFNEDTIKITLESGDEYNNITFDSDLHKLDATVDIGASEDIVFKIEGEVNEDLIGTITLDSKYANSKGTTTNETSNSVDANPEENKIEITKTAESETYYPNGEMVYNVVIENKGNSIINDISFADDVNKTKVELADGNYGDPFDPTTVTANIVSEETNLTTIPTVLVDGTGKVTSTTVFDIKPGKKITFQIKGTVNENAVGDIVNTATYEVVNGKTGKDTITTEPEENKIEITKTAESETYYPNGEMVYNIVIENKGNSIGNDIIFEDDINKEQVLLADGTNGNPFDVASITREIITGETTLTGTSPTLSKDTTGKVTSTSFDLKKDEKITFKITAKVNENVVGQIKNTANYSLDGTTTDSNEVTTEPQETDIKITKTAESETYYPNGEMVYNVVIENEGNSIGNDIIFEDAVNNIPVSLADGTEGDPFDISSITSEVVASGTSLSAADYPTLSKDTTGKVTSTSFDLKKDEKITFKITAKVNENVVGQIKNTANYSLDGTTTDSNEVTTDPEANKVEMTKTAESETYYPNGEMVYNVVIENTGNSIINDISFADDVSKTKVELADGNYGDPFDISSITSEVVASGTSLLAADYPTLSKDTTGKVTSTSFDLKKDEKITFKITAKVNENVVGQIKNTANYSLDGTTTDSNEVTTDPEETDVVITKTAESETYYPNGEMVYNVVIENEGNSIGNDIIFEDAVNNIPVSLADGTNGDPFDISSITSEVVASGTSLLAADYPTLSKDTTGKVTSTSFDLKKDEKITFKITAKVNENAVGDITNIATYKDANGKTEKNTATTEPQETDIKMTKTAESETYYPNGEIVYNVVIENTGNSIGNDIIFEDAVNNIPVSLADGTEGDPFDISSITSEVVASGTSLLAADYPTLSKDTTGKVTSTSFDLKKDEKITFKITAKVNENVVGQITNIASYILDGTTTDGDEVTTDPEANKVEMTKTAESETYYPNGEIVYNVVIENTGNSIGNDIIFEDAVNNIPVSLADGTEGDPFDISSITSEVVASGTSLLAADYPTLSKDTTGKVTSTSFDLKKDEKITFKITAKVNENVVGQITNIASYILDGTTTDGDEVTTDPEANKVEMTKTAESETYYPNGEIVYNVVIENIGNSIINDISFADDVNNEQVLLADGTNGDPFDISSITSEVVASGTSLLAADYPTLSKDTTGKVTSTSFDLKKTEKITFQITATVNKNAVGDITNIATYKDANGKTEKDTATIEPQETDIKITKTAESETYFPNGEMVYNVVIENEGNSIGNDIIFEDAVNNIPVSLADGTEGDPFDPTTVTAKVVESGTSLLAADYPTLSKDATGKVTSTSFDLKKTEKITFQITATVNKNAVGDITNIATYKDANGKTEKDTATIEPQETDIKITKTAESETYFPNGEMVYNVVIENEGNSIGNDIIFEDAVNNIPVSLADGTEGDPFDPTTVTAKVVESGTSLLAAYYPTLSKDATGKVTSTSFDLKKTEKITFQITATVNKNAVGDITNIATYKDANGKTEKDTATTEPQETDIKITKTAESENYFPNGEMVYNVVIENEGNSIGNDIIFEDAVNNIPVSLADGTEGDPFDPTTVTAKVVESGTSLLAAYYPTLSKDATGKVTSTSFDLKKTEKITFQITATVNKNAVGDITNIATYKDANGKTEKDTATTEPQETDIKITKTAESENYFPNGEMVYNVVIENEGNSIGNDIIFEDAVNNIPVSLADGTEGDPFDPTTVTAKVVESGTSLLAADYPTLSKDGTGKVTSTSFDLKKTEKITFQITATVNKNAVGDITNIATYKDANGKTEKDTATTEPQETDIKITKTAESENYFPNGEMVYNVVIENEGNSIGNDIIFEDAVNNIPVSLADGTEGDPFDISSITSEVVASGTSLLAADYPTLSKDGTGKVTSDTFDLKKDEKITFKITAKVNENVVGQITNIASYILDEKTTDSNKVITDPEENVIEMTKTAESTTYYPNGEMTYNVVIENKGNSIINDISFEDDVNKTKVELADGTEGIPFDISTVTSEIVTGETTLTGTNPTLSKDGTGKVTSTAFDIKAGKKITFKITAKVNENVVGQITNIASYILDGKTTDSNKVITDPEENVIEMTKTSESETYYPNGEMTYNVVIENKGNSIINDISFEDDVNKTKVELADGTEGIPFDISTVTSEVVASGTSLLAADYPTLSKDGTGKVTSTSFDLKKDEKITFKITAKVNENIVGQITNIASYILDGTTTDGDEVTTDPEANKVEMTKTAESETYYPNGEMTYNVVIENKGNSIINDISFEDDVNKTKVELADGTEGIPFDISTVTSEVVASGTSLLAADYPTLSKDTTGKVTSTSFDLKKDEKITFKITAKVNENIVGQITNIASYILDGKTTDSNKVITDPEENVIEMTKTAESTTYYPNGEMTYNVVIENKGNSIINDISFEDDVNKTKVELADGTEGIPFDISTVTSEIVTGETTLTGTNPTLSKDGTGKVTSDTFDLKKDEKITFKITAKVNENIVGQITNIASYILDGTTTDGDEVTTDPEENVIEMTKTAESTTYYPNGEMTYNVVIENKGNSIINDISFEDDVNKTKVELADGTEGIPFDISTVTSEIVTGETTLTGTNPTLSKDGTGKVTSTSFDLKKDEKITFKITAKVNENIVGQITNIASYILDGTTTDGDEVITDPEENVIEMTKTAESTTYYPNGEMTYNVVIENKGNSIINDISFEDDVNKTKVELADGTEGIPFDISTVTSEIVTGETTLTGTNPTLSKDGTGKVTSTAFDIKAGKKITFKITAKVNENVVGQITNIASYILDGTTTDGDEVITDPEENVIEMTKTAESTTYYPNGEMTYNVVIENKGNSIINDISFEDDVNKTKVELADGTEGIPFDISTVTSEVVASGTSLLAADYPTLSKDTTGKVTSTSFDLKKDEKITFKITAKVNENIVGQITNTASYILDGKTTDGNKVTTDPEENKIKITKTAETTTYFPNGEMIYNVVIENTGNSIINDISFADDVNKEQVKLSDGTVGNPFNIKTSTVTGKVVASGTSLLAGDYPDISVDATGKVTSDTFDIKAGEKITFQIKGTVNNNVVGDIKNTATYTVANGKSGEDTEITESEKANIILTKKALVDDNLKGYLPGGKIKYEITIENKGKGFGDNINITDEISKIMVDTVSGSAAAFSENDWEWTKKPEDLPNVIQNLVPFRGRDLDIKVDIESGKTLTLYVEGTVNPDAYGDIINTVTGKNGEDVIPPASATFIPSRSEVVMTHTVDKDVYEPGDYLTYTVTLENIGPGPAKGIDFKDNLKNIIVKTTNDDEAAFDLSTIEIVSSSIDPEVTQSEPLKLEDGKLTSYIENMPKDGKVTYIFKGKVRDDAVGEIINKAAFKYTDNDGTFKPFDENSIEVETKPTNAEITIAKEVDTEEYIAGKDLTYTVTLENIGTGNAKNIELTDKLSEIQAEYVDGTTGNVFDSWKITHIITKNSTLETDVTSVSSYDDSDDSTEDLDALVIDMAPSDKIEFTIVGKTNAKVKEGAVNTASFEYENNDGTLEKGEATTKESIPLLNDGKLLLTKTALKEEVEQGEFVEYEIIVRNVGETYFYNFFVEDKIPSGFEYVQGTTEMTRSGSDGAFDENDTGDDIVVTGEPVVGRTVNFSKVNLAPGESLKIAYLLKVSIGTTFGQYKNTAYALIDGELVSNEDSAIVTVIPDELFDTATIIGKVFEDINGDGYQGLATAKNIKIKGGITKDYIPNSLTVEKNNVKLKLNEETSSLVNGLIVDKLNGVSKNKVIEKNDKLTLRFLSKSKDWSPTEISTKAGTNILIDAFGNIKTTYTKDKKKGLSQENLLVTRNTYKSKNKNIYLHEIKIENIGVYEEGIPGVRLIVLDGVVVETDEFGRYHVPDKWVLDKKGENFLVKVDKLSIPEGMEILTENPLVRRISPNGLNKFNFSLKEKEVK